MIDKSPLEAPVAVVVPSLKLSALSSQPMNTLLESPLSITIPESPEGEPELPVPSSISWSSIVVFVALLVTVEPLTVKFPVIVALPPIVTLSGNPIVTTPELIDTSVSFDTPWKSKVPPNAIASEARPAPNVILEFASLEFAIEPDNIELVTEPTEKLTLFDASS